VVAQRCICAGVAEWLSRWPRDPNLYKKGL
jgi:hypothetical protein